VFLDAPPEVLFARKGEGSVEALARRRADYLLAARSIERFAIVDASKPEGEVTSEVARLIGELSPRRGIATLRRPRSAPSGSCA
jgi:thymidylate kinase